MGEKQTIKKDSSYYLTLTVVNWIDVFTRKSHKDLIIESLRYCIREKGLNIYAYCLMTNHLHLIANTENGFELKDVIRDFKKHTSKRLLEQIQSEPESRREWMMNQFAMSAADSSKHKNFKLWQTGNHAIELFSEKFVWEKINYIHKNPVKDGYVRKPEEWIYSSATNYNDEYSILPEVHCLAGRLVTYRLVSGLQIHKIRELRRIANPAKRIFLAKRKNLTSMAWL